MPIAVILSLIALGLSVYAVVCVGKLNVGGKDGDDAFKKQVYKVIDSYVAEKSGQAAQPSGPVDVKIGSAPVEGSANAPVTIIEYSDFQCPFCGRYASQTYPQIKKDYIDTGKVRYAFKYFPLPFHSQAAGAANAAACIREQGGDQMFFEYHDVLFANQTDLSVPKLKEYAAKFNIDKTKFNQCVDSNKYADAVQKDFTEGGQYGVRGTPAFFINGTPLAGAQPYEAFKSAIEDALKNKK